MYTPYSKKRFISCTIATLSFLLTLFVSTGYAQKTEKPKPGPEQKTMEVWVGKWNYEGKEEDAVFNTGGAFKGSVVTTMEMGGFIQVSKTKEKAGQYLDMTWYDAVSKTYMTQSFDNSGKVTTGSSTVNGNVWLYNGTMTDTKGITFKVKGTTTLSDDKKTAVNKTEISKDDGKTWMLWWESTSHKK